jgi:hypothetical protein
LTISLSAWSQVGRALRQAVQRPLQRGQQRKRSAHSSFPFSPPPLPFYILAHSARSLLCVGGRHLGSHLPLCGRDDATLDLSMVRFSLFTRIRFHPSKALTPPVGLAGISAEACDTKTTRPTSTRSTLERVSISRSSSWRGTRGRQTSRLLMWLGTRCVDFSLFVPLPLLPFLEWE